MLHELTWRQLMRWMEYDRVEPLGDLRGDWQAASICSTIANMTMVAHRIETRFTPADWLLEFKEGGQTEGEPAPATAPVGKTWQEMKFISRMMVAAAKADEAAAARRKRRR
jgi:hypothetical protein